MRWTRNDSLAFDATMKAGDKIRSMWDQYQAGQAFKEGSQQSEINTQPTTQEQLDSYRQGVTSTGDDQIPDYGYSAPAAPSAGGLRYGLGKNPTSYQDKPFTPQELREAGLQNVASYKYGKGDFEGGSALETGLLQRETSRAGLRAMKRAEDRELLDARNEELRNANAKEINSLMDAAGDESNPERAHAARKTLAQYVTNSPIGGAKGWAKYNPEDGLYYGKSEDGKSIVATHAELGDRWDRVRQQLIDHKNSVISSSDRDKAFDRGLKIRAADNDEQKLGLERKKLDITREHNVDWKAVADEANRIKRLELSRRGELNDLQKYELNAAKQFDAEKKRLLEKYGNNVEDPKFIKEIQVASFRFGRATGFGKPTAEKGPSEMSPADRIKAEEYEREYLSKTKGWNDMPAEAQEEALAKRMEERWGVMRVKGSGAPKSNKPGDPLAALDAVVAAQRGGQPGGLQTRSAAPTAPAPSQLTSFEYLGPRGPVVNQEAVSQGRRDMIAAANAGDKQARDILSRYGLSNIPLPLLQSWVQANQQ